MHVLTPRLRKSPIREFKHNSTCLHTSPLWKAPLTHRSALLEYARSKYLPTSQVPHEGIGSYAFPPTFDTQHQPAAQDNVLVTASFGHIIPNSFLSRFDPRKRLNVHPSLLPRYRGAAPVQWTIANGDRETGVSVQRLVERGKGIDGGEIVGSVEGVVSRRVVSG